MEQQIWSKSEEKWAYILVLRDHQVHQLKVTGSPFSLKGKIEKVMNALQEGQAPALVGAKSVETLDLASISKAEIAPGNGNFTIYGEGEKPQSINYTTGDSDADAIFQTIIARSGRTFQSAQEEVGVVEAVMPPIFFGGLIGIFWGVLYYTAGQIAAGEEVEAKGRRKGVKQLLNWAAETLGTNGTIAVGVVLLALMIAWAVKRIIHRPKRTVWLPEKA